MTPATITGVNVRAFLGRSLEEASESYAMDNYLLLQPGARVEVLGNPEVGLFGLTGDAALPVLVPVATLDPAELALGGRECWVRASLVRIETGRKPGWLLAIVLLLIAKGA